MCFSNWAPPENVFRVDFYIDQRGPITLEFDLWYPLKNHIVQRAEEAVEILVDMEMLMARNLLNLIKREEGEQWKRRIRL